VEVSAPLVAAFVKRDWIARGARGGVENIYILSDAGLGWLARAEAQDDPFASQHQLRRAATLKDARGVEQPVTVNDAESPLARLRQRRLIGRVQFEAGETLRRDFTLAGLSPRLGVDLAAPVLARTRGQAAQSRINDTVLAAKQRFAAAMRAVGPGLSDLLFDVCCHLRGLEDAERAKGWPGRSGRVVLGIALDRLADHYGLRVRGTAKLRGWQMEEEA
jgi:hypothetical protein